MRDMTRLSDGRDSFIDKDAELIPGDYASKASNTPFTGWKLKGRVKATICGGAIAYEDEA